MSDCQASCLKDRACTAIDFYASSGWCNRFSAACTTPQRGGGASWRLDPRAEVVLAEVVSGEGAAAGEKAPTAAGTWVCRVLAEN